MLCLLIFLVFCTSASKIQLDIIKTKRNTVGHHKTIRSISPGCAKNHENLWFLTAVETKCLFHPNSEYLSVLFKGRCVELPKNLLALYRKQEKTRPSRKMMFGRWHVLFILGDLLGCAHRNLRVPLPKPKVWKTILSFYIKWPNFQRDNFVHFSRWCIFLSGVNLGVLKFKLGIKFLGISSR